MTKWVYSDGYSYPAQVMTRRVWLGAGPVSTGERFLGLRITFGGEDYFSFHLHLIAAGIYLAIKRRS